MAEAKWSTKAAKATAEAADQIVIIDSDDAASKLVSLDDLPLSLATDVRLGGASAPSPTELTYVAGATSAIQTQIGLKAPIASPTFTGTLTVPVGLTGVLKAATGVMSVATANSDYVTPINPAPATNPGYSGVPVSATNGSGGNMVFGDVCYVHTDGTLKLIDASALATMRGMYICVGTAAGGVGAAVANGAAGLFLQFGYIKQTVAWGTGAGGILTIGTAAPIFGTITGTTTNTCSQAAPAAGGGNFLQVLGFPIAADVWCFNPSIDVFAVA